MKKPKCKCGSEDFFIQETNIYKAFFNEETKQIEGHHKGCETEITCKECDEPLTEKFKNYKIEL